MKVIITKPTGIYAYFYKRSPNFDENSWSYMRQDISSYVAVAKREMEKRLMAEYNIEWKTNVWESPVTGIAELVQAINAEAFSRVVPTSYQRLVADWFNNIYGKEGLYLIKQGGDFWLCKRNAFERITYIDIWA